MAKQKKNELIKIRTKINKSKKGTNNLITSVSGYKNNEAINGVNKSENNKKESKDINQKYHLRNKVINYLEEKAQLETSLSSNVKNNNNSKYYPLFNQALFIIDFYYNHVSEILENKEKNFEVKDSKQQEQNFLEQSNCSTTDLSFKIVEETIEIPSVQKKSKSVRHKKKFTIDLLRLKGHFQEDQYFKLLLSIFCPPSRKIHFL